MFSPKIDYPKPVAEAVSQLKTAWDTYQKSAIDSDSLIPVKQAFRHLEQEAKLHHTPINLAYLTTALRNLSEDVVWCSQQPAKDITTLITCLVKKVLPHTVNGNFLPDYTTYGDPTEASTPAQQMPLERIAVVTGSRITISTHSSAKASVKSGRGQTSKFSSALPYDSEPS